MMGRNGLVRTTVLTGALVFLLGGCEESIGAPTIADAELRVLFVGNSLTYTHDVPAMVQTIAEASGHTFAYTTVARPNYSLEDHWHSGVGRTIEALRADVVVFQQGPSSLPASQAHLLEWAQRLAPVVREAGGTPAFYMVWPDASRTFAFDAVRSAYSAAAADTDGLFLPAGVAWQRAWSVDDRLPLYGPDNFHPSELGSAVAALTIFSVLFDTPVDGLPSRIVPTTPGLPVIDLGAAASAVLGAVEEAVESNGSGRAVMRSAHDP